MKNYEILLCEEYLVASGGITPPTNSSVDQELRVRFVAEIGSSSSTFSGKAIDPIFYTKIDGTHELTFELPKYYFDENTGEKVFNELTDLLVNKCKILLRFPDEGEDYYLVINERADEEKDGQFKYTYSCNDAFIEELSKTGYGLVFDDDVEGNGLADIHQLATEILKDTDWGYDYKDTGYMGEYRTEVNYNTTQGRYDTVQIPHPVHPIEYIPELERYCYKVDQKYKIDGNSIYCYEDTEQVTSNTVQNILYNTRDFVSDDGWLRGENTSFMPSKAECEKLDGTAGTETKYCLRVPKSDPESDPESILINATATESNKTIKANKPYLFHIEYSDLGSTREGKGGLTKIEIYDQNPLLEDNEGNTPSPKYSLSFGGQRLVGSWDYSGIRSRYVVIKTQESIRNPYVQLTIDTSDAGTDGVYIRSIHFFELKTVRDPNLSSGFGTDEETYFSALKETPNGKMMNMNIDGSYPAIKGLDPSAPDDYVSRNYKVCLPADVISAQTIKRTLYFYLEGEAPNRTAVYVDFNDLENKPDVLEKEKLPIIGEESVELTLIPIPNLNDFGLEEVKVSTNVYKLKNEDKYYQYYQLTKNGRSGGAWDLALLGNGLADKRRTLKAEKSNRFNLLQELAELFKTWCIFETKIGENNELQKKVYFRENVINPNFSGFHSGVNLRSLERKVESDEIVTKMYVEDVESDFANDGFVTIRTSSLNPWGENYYYNFKYYGEQKLLSPEDVKKLESDKEALYSAVKGKNATIYELNDKIINAKMEIKNLTYQIESLNYAIAAAMERIASIDADIANYEISQPDKEQLAKNRQDNENRRSEYETELIRATEARTKIEEEYNDWTGRVEELQEEKKTLIKNFENIYAQFIKEGVWSDSTYSDNDTYFLDSQKVSLTSAMPKMSWNISAIDGSVLHELEDFKVKVGDQTILVDNEFFPSKEAKEHVFEVLISGIKEHLDDGTKNEIEIRNYLTRFEDLFQRISAATQTLELNEQTYNRAANFTADGHIDQSLLERSLLENASILANSSDNSYKLDQTGLHLQSLINPVKKLRIVADGIVLSDSLDDNGKEKWTTGISADGINADKITTGSLDTSLIRIYSGGQPSFTWSNLGITAYRGKTTVHHDSANPQPIIAAIGDSYAEGYNASSTPIKDQSIGWIAELKKKTGLNILGTGKGASGFNPYYHLPASIETPNEFCFIKQLTAIFEQCGDNPAKLPQYIIIGGGFNDKNMEITDRVVKESPETPEKKEDYYNTDLLLDVQLKDDKDGYVLLEQYALDGESGHKDECHYMLNATTSSDGSVTINGKNYSWKKHSGNAYPVNDDEDGTDMASMEALKEAMKALNRAIFEKYTLTYGLDKPKVILVSMGRYKGLRAFREDENGEKIYTRDDGLYSELVNTHLFREKVYQTYKDQAEIMGWQYYDISGLMSPSAEESQDNYHDWVKEAIIIDKGEGYFKNDSLLRFEKESLVFQPDNVHPTGLGASVIADLVWDILKKELPESKTASSTTVDGNSFIRMDKYGIYSIDNHLGFNYTTDGTSSYPWFHGLDKYTALNKIRANSGFSLTDAGFSLNIPNAGKGSIFLGYEKLGKPNYGLYITNNKGESVIKLQNDIDDLKIGGWQLTSTSLLSKKQAPGDSKHNLITYLCTTDTPGGTAFALGKIAKEDEPGTAPFVVTGEGKLRATGATITGEINADEGRIGPFTVESERVKKTDAEEVKGAIILGESCATGGEISWVDELANRINAENIYKKADTFAGFATGKNKVTIPEIIPQNTNDIWVNIIESVEHYWKVQAHSNGTFSWKELDKTQLLDANDTRTVLYDPLNKYVFYRDDQKTLRGIRLDSATVNSTDIMGKEMKIIKTSYNTKEDIPIYYFSEGSYSSYFRRKKVNGTVKYVSYRLNPTEGMPQELEPFDSSKIYYYAPTGAFIYPEKDADGKVTKWNYFKGDFGNFGGKKIDIVPIKISNVLPPEIDPDNTHQRGYPSETIMYYEIINEIQGYWYQDFDLNWKWTNNTTKTLLEIGHPKIKYKLPPQFRRGFFSCRTENPIETTDWFYTSEVISENSVSGVLSFVNDPDQVYNIKDIGYHMGSGEYIQSGTPPTSANPTVTRHKSSIFVKPFFTNILTDPDKKDKSYQSPAKVYIYYSEADSDWIVFARNFSEHGNPYFEKMKTFTSLLPERGADIWKNLTHIFVGGSWHERALTESDNEFLELGMRQFLNTVIDRNVSGNNVKITISAVSYSKNSFMNNQVLRKTEVAYYDKVVSLRTESPYKEKLTLVFTNPSENWPTAPGAVMSEGQGKDWAPTKEGVEAMVDEIASRYELVYRGCFYGKTLDTSNKKVSSGFSLKSTSERAVALWAHYVGEYNTPMDDFEANSKNTNSAIKNQWADNTSFYVTQGGELHSKKAYITGGNIGGCTFVDGHLEIPGAYIKDLTVSEANIETLQVGKLRGTEGACKYPVTFTNITATGEINAIRGTIGNWTISSGNLSGEGIFSITKKNAKITLNKESHVADAGITIHPSGSSSSPSSHVVYNGPMIYMYGPAIGGTAHDGAKYTAQGCLYMEGMTLMWAATTPDGIWQYKEIAKF